MSNIIKISTEERENGKTKDAIKYNKDCCDFRCLNDGTILGESKYCDLSLHCRQTDVTRFGTIIGMESHFLPVIDPVTGDIKEHHLFCTGFHDLRPHKERLEDDKAK